MGRNRRRSQSEEIARYERRREAARSAIAKAVQAHADATAAAKSDKVVNEAKEKVIADKIKAAVKAEEYEELEQLKAELTGQAAASKEDEPILRRFKTNDPTVEKLGEYCVRTRRAPLHAR
jgi:hypothetical protein